MKKIHVYHVDAFTNEAFGGNPAGVIPDATGLSTDNMQKIAKELNLSETAFLTPFSGTGADFRIRYFTPTQEIDFCGHATLGSAWIIGTEFNWMKKITQVKFSSNIGIVPVELKNKGENLESVLMTQVTPKVKEIDSDREILARLLGINVDDLDMKYPIRLGYTGNWHLLIPVKTRKAIDQATPILKELKVHNCNYNICTTHLFTFDSQVANCKIYTRDFAPAVGIDEDPVTGAANGALAGYLILEGILPSHSYHEFSIAQGHAIKRPGKVDIQIHSNENHLIIKVGGSAVTTIAGQLLVNFD